MKCPKCDGELRITRSSVVNDYVEVDLVCNGNDEHAFFTRIHDEDLIEVE
jgi:hypothetical protein